MEKRALDHERPEASRFAALCHDQQHDDGALGSARSRSLRSVPVNFTNFSKFAIALRSKRDLAMSPDQHRRSPCFQSEFRTSAGEWFARAFSACRWLTRCTNVTEAAHGSAVFSLGVRASPSERATPRTHPGFCCIHDTVGLGNIRRTLLLAETLGEQYPNASLLIVTGSPMIHAFRIPERTDYIKLPCLTRHATDRFAPAYLPSPLDQIAKLRQRVIATAVLGFAPDLIIVDKRAGGIDGELLESLREVRRRRRPVKIVLGIRDILDAPQATRLSLKRCTRHADDRALLRRGVDLR